MCQVKQEKVSKHVLHHYNLCLKKASIKRIETINKSKILVVDILNYSPIINHFF